MATITITGAVNYDQLFDPITVTGATNASPIVIQCASHTLLTGDRVTIAGVGGNTAANGTRAVTYVDATHFSLDGTTGNGAWTSGGTVNPEFATVSAAKAGNDTHNIDGGYLTIDTDTRWCKKHSATTGNIGTLSLSSIYGGTVKLDGTNVRLIPYASGTGNVPVTGDLLYQGGGSVVGELLGVWSDINTTPTTAGSAMPATGFIKIKNKTGGNFANADTIKITSNSGTTIATASAADKIGWIEVAIRGQWGGSNPGAFFIATGEWFEIGTTNGSANQTMQAPASLSGTLHACVWVSTTATPTTDDDYEPWPCLYDTGSARINDARNKVCWVDTSGLVRFGNDGSSNVGYVPPTGMKVVVPNIIQVRPDSTTQSINQASYDWAWNTRPQLGYPIAATNVDFYKTTGFMHLSSYQGYHGNAVFECCGILGQFAGSTISVNLTFDRCGQNYLSGDTGGIGSNYTPTNYGTLNISNCTVCRPQWVISRTFGLSTITNFLVIADADKAGFYFPTWNFSGGGTLTNITVVGGALDLGGSGLVLTNFILAGSIRNATPGCYYGLILGWNNGCSNVVVDGVSAFISGSTNCLPGNGYPFVNFNGGSNMTLRNVGTYASPFNLGAVTPGLVGSYQSNSDKVRVQRCWVTNPPNAGIINNTGYSLTADIYDSGVVGSESSNGNSVDQSVPGRVTYRKYRGKLNLLYTLKYIGQPFNDQILSDTTGQVVVLNCAPDTTSTDYHVVTGSASSPNVLPVIGDTVTVTQYLYRIIGHTGFSVAAATIGYWYGGSFTHQTKWLIEYQLDSGSGFSGTWANLAKSVITCAGTSGLFTITVSSSAGLADGDYVFGGSVGTGARIATGGISGTTLTLTVANAGTFSGQTLTFNHIPGETISPSVGFMLKIRYTAREADTTMSHFLTIPTVTTLTDQQANLHPLDVSTITIASVVAGSRVLITKVSDNSVLKNELISGTSYSTTVDYAGSVRVELRKASASGYYKPWYTIVTADTEVVAAITALQEADS